MKKTTWLIILIAASVTVQSQILTSDPPFPTPDDEITIFYNVASGNAQIPVSTVPIFAHTGVVSQEDEDNCQNNWQYVQGNWGTSDPNVIMTPLGGGLHKIVITPSTFYDYPSDLEIGRLMFVFRNGTGSLVGRNADGSDIYFELYDESFHAGILAPYQQDIISTGGTDVPIHAASSEPATLTLFVDDVEVASATDATELDYIFNETVNGAYNVTLVANNGEIEITDNTLISIDPSPAVVAAPAGTLDGITYTGGSSVRLQIYAPNKDFIYVLGDFNGWQFNADYLMNRTPDGDTYWLDINGLDPNIPYRFQYSIDAEDMRVADVYSETILDSWNDPYIPAVTYPGLLEYPTCSTTQAVSVFQIGQPEFNWTDASFVRPSEERLVIYELLVRDFTEQSDYITLTDSLDYLQNLGVTAIELMPINEFEGNDSWGYNPSFYFAQDKAYGTKEALKTFVNECHVRGIAVIQDIALNHSFGQNPMVRMYFDPEAGEYGQPTAESPWFNQVPKHDFNVGYDFNHESTHTRSFVKRVLSYWLDEYHIDGYRFDLSKGFTQNNTLGNIAAWAAYDASRVAILTDYYNHIQTTEPGAYVILEHLADNSEETVLSAAGMMPWGNLSHEYQEGSMGFSSNFSWGSYMERGWSDPHLVTYAESHDEERMMYKNINFGNNSGSYDINDLATALHRQELAYTFLTPIPGPKMMWQFSELGYDYSINYCQDGTINDDCRTYAKPVRWDYLEVADRYKVYKVVSALNNLKKTEALFSTTDFDIDAAGMGKRIHLNSAPMNATIVGNFNVTSIDMVPGFQHTGTWYDYFTGNSFEVTNLAASSNYSPGEYHLFLDQQLETPDTTLNVKDAMSLFNIDFMLFPNPARDVVTIGFSNHLSGKVRIDLLDMTGNVVRNIDEKNMPAGKQVISWNTGNLAHGAYLVRITTATGQMTKPLMIADN